MTKTDFQVVPKTYRIEQLVRIPSMNIMFAYSRQLKSQAPVELTKFEWRYEESNSITEREIASIPMKYLINMSLYIYNGLENQQSLVKMAGYCKGWVYKQIQQLQTTKARLRPTVSRTKQATIVRARITRTDDLNAFVTIVLRDEATIRCFSLCFTFDNNNWILDKFDLL